MRPHSAWILIVFAAVAVVGPLGLWATSVFRSGASRAPSQPLPRSLDWRLMLTSGLLYALAFSLVFLVQEVFLVLPKAITPGLHPVLFHNNHTWTGDNPLAALFQGTGALVILLLGSAALIWSVTTRSSSYAARLFGLWIAYNGFCQSLPQLIAGAVLPGNDVGMAMDYMKLGATARAIAALVGMTTIPLAAIWLKDALLATAPAEISGAPQARSRLVFQAAVVPMILALPLIFICRMPGSWDQVYLVPIVVALVGAPWMQAAARLPFNAGARPADRRPSPVLALVAVLVLLGVFQLVLRRGIAF